VRVVDVRLLYRAAVLAAMIVVVIVCWSIGIGPGREVPFGISQ
jgi:hypothetical protein